MIMNYDIEIDVDVDEFIKGYMTYEHLDHENKYS